MALVRLDQILSVKFNFSCGLTKINCFNERGGDVVVCVLSQIGTQAAN